MRRQYCLQKKRTNRKNRNVLFLFEKGALKEQGGTLLLLAALLLIAEILILQAAIAIPSLILPMTAITDLYTQLSVVKHLEQNAEFR